MTQIRQLRPDHRRTTEEHADSPPSIPVFREQAQHVLVVLVEDSFEVRTPEMCPGYQTGKRGHRLGRRPVLLEKASVDVERYGGVLEFLGEVWVDPDVNVRAVGRGGDLVEEGGEPEEVVLLRNDPVEISPAVSGQVQAARLRGVGVVLLGILL